MPQAVGWYDGAMAELGAAYPAPERTGPPGGLYANGPVHETYLVGPQDAEAPDLWRTEIGWPIFRLTSA